MPKVGRGQRRSTCVLCSCPFPPPLRRLVGLALDYDVFLVSRIIEFRKLGWSDRASACLAVEKTGGVITTAGLIMIISFAGVWV